jgi:RNA polymerase sigma-70 factor, ECF subfamily
VLLSLAPPLFVAQLIEQLADQLVAQPFARPVGRPLSSLVRAGRGGEGASNVSTPDADDLVARCRQGEREAFRELFVRHRADVVRLVYRMLGPRADVEDVVQDVFLQVYRSLRDFRGDAKFSTWLHRVTVNVVLMARRAAKSRPTHDGTLDDDAPQLDGVLPDEDASRRERLRAFQRCIDRLPEKKRVVFILHELEGLPAAEIASVVGAPVLTVRTRLFYARRELARFMYDEPALNAFAARFERGDDRPRNSDIPSPRVREEPL